ncbi:MAG: hypothetical protein NW205_01645 [Hyphomicrobiaceae bacterium]|nr:hypothetical protein [Hyphomicrobiaceae bacterium]
MCALPTTADTSELLALADTEDVLAYVADLTLELRDLAARAGHRDLADCLRRAVEIARRRS